MAVPSQECGYHPFLSTIDDVLIILQGTLTGAQRILNHNGSQTPFNIPNTMHSVRVALDTLLVHIGYTNQKKFEPKTSIIRELLSPSLTLFQEIFTDVNIPELRYYDDVSDTEKYLGQDFKPNQILYPPDTYFPFYPQVNRDHNLELVVTADGLIRVELPLMFQIDLTIDEAIFIRNMRDNSAATISACGTYAGLRTELCHMYQHGKTVEILITDAYKCRNMFSKMTTRGIHLGGINAPCNVLLKENDEIITIKSVFQDLEDDFMKNAFLRNSSYGPEYYNICAHSLSCALKTVLMDGSLHLTWKDIKIVQYATGEVIIAKNRNNFFIYCCPEETNSFSGTNKKGIIKVATPLNRTVSTVITHNNKQEEKYVLVNSGKQWMYYNHQDIIISNETLSTGYSDMTK